jgi:hypothetical protein
VLIKNIIVEKYSRPAQNGAINGRNGTGWTVEASEIRWNSGAGISIGNEGRIIDSNIHHNKQIGAIGVGRNVLLKGNEIWADNIYGFDYGWEAGGVKVAASVAAVMAGNYVHRNIGPGLWCGINCEDALYENNTVEL